MEENESRGNCVFSKLGRNSEFQHGAHGGRGTNKVQNTHTHLHLPRFLGKLFVGFALLLPPPPPPLFLPPPWGHTKHNVLFTHSPQRSPRERENEFSSLCDVEFRRLEE